MSAGFTVSLADLAADGDAAWFAAHPDRTARIRAFVEGEMPCSMPSGDGFAATVVRQIRPGVRARVPVYLARKPGDDEASALGVLQMAMGGAA